MRILKVISSLHFGGAETQVINLSRELVRQGHQVSLVSLSNDVPRLIELKGSGVEILIENKKKKIDISVISRLRKHIKSWRPDIIHGYLYDAEFYCRIAAINLNVPVINSERNDNYKFNKNQIIGDLLTSWLVDGVIANSYAGMSFSKKRYKQLADDKFHVVWNGIDIAKINQRLESCKKSYKQEIFEKEDIMLACMVASIKEQKNYELALRVAEEIINIDKKWRVVFIGDKLAESDDQYKSQIYSLYNESKQKDKIKFLGNRVDAIEIMSQSDISFLTSHYEGFPNVMLESMSVGTPIITTDFSDIKRIALCDWMIIEKADPVEFAKAINYALTMREDLSAQSISWANANCAINVAAKNLANVYGSFIECL
jgi:glycosyltransferase involved in cell wall biosynthesis